jgi:SpoVK/Ycf46/Vps4 family AAA+-type ATPase
MVLDPEYLELFTTGRVTKPRLSTSFPAQMITTEMDWNDLVLPDNTLAQIHEIETWVKYNEVILYEWGMKKKIKPGFRCLFYGPPGTGKTLTATLLGKTTGRDVFRIDLSTVISKYIGETEKNLASLFDKAESKEWILFFDEADALFGKRTNIRDAHDKYANQEVSYLLQRIENHSGLVILASNFKSNIDEAFTRRFQSIIYFPAPDTQERQLLWEKSFPSQLKLSRDISFDTLASRYELTGANIINVVQYVSLKSLEQGNNTINKSLLTEGIRKEYEKEGRIFT